MMGIGIREYLSGDLNGDYFYSLLTIFLLMFSTFGMFGLFVKEGKKWTLSPSILKFLIFLRFNSYGSVIEVKDYSKWKNLT